MIVTGAHPAVRHKIINVRELAIPLLLGLLILVVAAGFLLNWRARQTSVEFPTPYQAVLFSNGAVYYGQLEGYGTPNPILTHVFYIVTRTDPNTKAASNVLVKRGKEMHGPDRMYINPASIVFVETVSPTSKVAQLVSQAASQ